MDHLKHPATIISSINVVATAATIYYVHQQITGLRATVADLERQLNGLKLTIETIKEQDGIKAKIVKDTKENIQTLSAQTSQDMEALHSYIAAMNTDLYGLTDQLNASGVVQVELPSVASAMANYHGEMHFPSQHSQFNSAYGTIPTVTPSTILGPNPSSVLNSNLSPNVNKVPSQMMSNPRQNMALPGSHAPLAGAIKIPGGMPHYQQQQHYHPPQMQMRAGGGRGGYGPGLAAPTKHKEADPIGDLVDLAQSQPE